MLVWRLTLGTLFAAALAALVWLDYHASRPGAYLLPLAIVVSLLGAGELLAMYLQRGREPLRWAIYGGVLLVVLAAGLGVLVPSPRVGGIGIGESMDSPLARLGWLTIGLAFGWLLAAVGELRRYDGTGEATTNLALTSLVILYLGGLVGMLVQLRLLGIGGPDGGRTGMLALASLLIVVKLSDIGQYTAGRLFGIHKLAPRVSPGKTWQGLAGGIAFALVGGAATIWLAGRMGIPLGGPDRSGAWRIAVVMTYAVALALAGVIGDLLESLLKRDAGVKDSSTWMPGFGGVLDLLDSLLVAAPVGYLFWVLVLAPA